ncbi:bifunctional metallophosphatase/5'-nucleotidase [Aquabacterium sp.]|uniref:bifunctional metallophosphatase/5'-nucleotidase n=1 Tax=Aquabacterium sp. TaxID=1872578 RepID=UPI002CB51BAF|nr:bifunctional metallophosphatase/5'-nucleotidase [Aquabacterium sp.]HSW09260.1 bifunctional metallophosphatase/5'-nucleotidase [Aquabacterium sp.]
MITPHRLPALGLFALVPVALGMLAGCAAPPSAPPAEPVRLRVIGFNDFHGNLETTSQTLTLPDPAKPGATQRVAVGGAAPMAGLIAALRAGSPHSLVISAGDMVGAAPMVSTLFRHESTIEVMNRIGVDVGTPGNHEFDAGTAELKRLVGGGCAANDLGQPSTSCALQPRYAGARFPLVVANVEGPDGQPLFAPSWVTQVGPVKVGVIGAVTRGTPNIVVPSGVAGLRFTDEAEAINRAARALKGQGVNTLIVTMHEGGEIGSAQQPGDWNDDSCPNLRGPIVALAQRITPDVDLIISGHSHQGYRCKIDGRYVVQSTSYGRGLSATDLVIDPRSGAVDRSATRSRNLPILHAGTDAAQRAALLAAEPPPWGDALRKAQAAPEVAQQVGLFTTAAAPRTQRVVGQIGGSFERGRGGNSAGSSAGQMIADAQLAATRDAARGGAQFALMNIGGVRADLLCAQTPPCPVTFGQAFTMQPFGNSLVVMSFTGTELKALLESQHPPGRSTAYLLQASASLSYRWLAKAEFGQRVQDLRVNGQAVQPDAEYRVTVNSFLAEGGDGLTLLKTGRQRIGGMLDVDALVEHLRSTPVPQSGGRITVVD